VARGTSSLLSCPGASAGEPPFGGPWQTIFLIGRNGGVVKSDQRLLDRTTPYLVLNRD
jgi:hypothetical protein